MAASRPKTRSRTCQGAALENCVSGEALGRERCQYPHPCTHPPSSEDVLREVEERLLASPHIPEEWWILGPPTCPPFAGTCAPCDHDPDLRFHGESYAASRLAADDASGCGEAHCCESASGTDGRECAQFHVDVDLHVAAAGVEDGGEACVLGDCECLPPSPAPSEVSLVPRALVRVPLENLPDVVDNCSEREMCMEEAAGEGKDMEDTGRDCGGGVDQQADGGPSGSHKRRTIYV